MDVGIAVDNSAYHNRVELSRPFCPPAIENSRESDSPLVTQIIAPVAGMTSINGSESSRVRPGLWPKAGQPRHTGNARAASRAALRILANVEQYACEAF